MSVNITNAYARYRSQSNALLDFAVLVAHAVPTLKTEIQAVKAGTLAHLPRPDFFQKSNRSTADDLLKTEAHYERYLASYVLLAHFSVFKSFVEDLIKELSVFHGGEAEFLARIESRVGSFLARQANEKTGAKRKLQDSDKPASLQEVFANEVADEARGSRKYKPSSQRNVGAGYTGLCTTMLQ